MVDKRCKYRIRETRNFYLFIKYKNSHIYYAKFPEHNKTLSTGKTNLRDAYIEANRLLSEFNYDSLEFHRMLLEAHKDAYYKTYNMAKRLSDLLSDVKTLDQINLARLVKLQQQLLDTGISGKSVNNYMSLLRKLFKNREYNPFANLSPIDHQKIERKCFPVSKFNHQFKDLSNKYDLLAFCAIVTGCRRSELMNIKKEDIYETDGLYYVHIRGTKTENAVRDVPLSKYSRDALLLLLDQKITKRDFERCVEYIGKKIGCYEMIKRDNIVFHGYRKCFCSILNQANINTSLIEMIIGHSTKNQASNDVRKIYFVEDRIDASKIHALITNAFDYLYN